jgi:hypothetical protein
MDSTFPSPVGDQLTGWKFEELRFIVGDVEILRATAQLRRQSGVRAGDPQSVDYAGADYDALMTATNTSLGDIEKGLTLSQTYRLRIATFIKPTMDAKMAAYATTL